MSVEKITEDSLRGQPFIAKEEDGIPRTCGTCAYGDDDGHYKDECLTSEPSKLFGEEVVPKELDGKEVGHYCPLWMDFRGEE